MKHSRRLEHALSSSLILVLSAAEQTQQATEKALKREYIKELQNISLLCVSYFHSASPCTAAHIKNAGGICKNTTNEIDVYKKHFYLTKQSYLLIFTPLHNS